MNGLDDFIREYLKEEPDDSGVREIWNSYLLEGHKLFSQGDFHGAIVEYEKEHNRPIHKPVDAEIVQTSYCDVGRAYQKLGEIEKALEAYLKAHELKEKHGVGWGTHAWLAEIYIALGRLDDAIAICEAATPAYQHKYEQQLLAKAIALKNSRS